MTRFEGYLALFTIAAVIAGIVANIALLRAYWPPL
jgi:hypothetical protein